MDLFVSISFLLLASPIMLILSVLIQCSMGSPILFRQARPGFRGRVFQIYKFRTMRDGRDSKGQLLSDRERLTRLGRWMRKLSLDEMPQLFNVIRGDMSLVGPRPLLVSYLNRYSKLQSRRHEVLPGITGWAQVNGRNAISWSEKFELDIWYVDHCSIWVDIKILFLTIAKVLLRDGINVAGQDTGAEFKGD